ncbi:hypothetical protein, partial [Proteus vulgaris]|uniref:hypothetical protein n=1 Tax=Proteus vulgaris TaxID=585 RepID=UPI0019533F45
LISSSIALAMGSVNKPERGAEVDGDPEVPAANSNNITSINQLADKYYVSKTSIVNDFKLE